MNKPYDVEHNPSEKDNVGGNDPDVAEVDTKALDNRKLKQVSRR